MLRDGCQIINSGKTILDGGGRTRTNRTAYDCVSSYNIVNSRTVFDTLLFANNRITTFSTTAMLNKKDEFNSLRRCILLLELLVEI